MGAQATRPGRIQGALAGAVILALWLAPGVAAGAAEAGRTVLNEELPTLDGGRAPLLSSKARVNLVIFFRPSHDRSLDTLKAMAGCEQEFAGKAVHWVAVVSDSHPPEQVRSTVAEAGIRMPVLVDRGDTLYGELEVRQHPAIGLVDDQGVLLDLLPFRRINYCDMIRVRIRHALHEVDQAAVERIDHPPRALMPNEVPGAVAGRHVKLGERFLGSGQWAKAAVQGRIALEKDPTLGAAHALLGRALAGQGKCREAAPFLERALKLDPGNASAAEGRRGCGAGK
jgi:hypothetical protein